jgi:hypothetical protein
MGEASARLVKKYNGLFPVNMVMAEYGVNLFL